MASIQPRKDREGNIVSYRIRVFLGEDVNGKQVVKQTSFKVEPGWSEKTAKKKAEAEAARFEDEVKRGLVADGKQTFEEYLSYYIQYKESRGMKPTTISLYNSLAERLINPRIGYIKLKDLGPKHLNELYNALSADGLRRGGGQLSAKTRLEVHRLIHAALGQAVKEGAVISNVADKVDPPRREEKEPVFYEPETVEKILAASENEPEQWRMLILFLLASGCRRGEALGLMWKDVDKTNNRVYIHKNLTYTKEKGPFLDSPKTKKSVRFITLPVEVMNALYHHKAEQAQVKLRVGQYYNDKDFVFARENGDPLHPCSVTSYMTKFSKKYDLPKMNPHGFRHTAASMLIFKGFNPVEVSKRLGHDDVSTTLDIYSHVFDDADSRAADAIAEALNFKKA